MSESTGYSFSYNPLTSKQLIEVLKLAKAKIFRKKNWTQRAYAKDATGKSLDMGLLTNYFNGINPDLKPVCYCSLGAVCMAALEYHAKNPSITYRNIYYDTRAALSLNTYEMRTGQSIAIFNDNRDHASVIKMFNEAIKNLSEA